MKYAPGLALSFDIRSYCVACSTECAASCNRKATWEKLRCTMAAVPCRLCIGAGGKTILHKVGWHINDVPAANLQRYEIWTAAGLCREEFPTVVRLKLNGQLQLQIVRIIIDSIYTNCSAWHNCVLDSGSQLSTDSWMRVMMYATQLIWIVNLSMHDYSHRLVAMR